MSPVDGSLEGASLRFPSDVFFFFFFFFFFFRMFYLLFNHDTLIKAAKSIWVHMRVAWWIAMLRVEVVLTR